MRGGMGRSSALATRTGNLWHSQKFVLSLCLCLADEAAFNAACCPCLMGGGDLGAT